MQCEQQHVLRSSLIAQSYGLSANCFLFFRDFAPTHTLRSSLWRVLLLSAAITDTTLSSAQLEGSTLRSPPLSLPHLLDFDLDVTRHRVLRQHRGVLDGVYGTVIRVNILIAYKRMCM